MAAIFDCPMAAVDIEKTFGAGFLCRSTGDAVSDFTGALAGLFVYKFPFNGEYLSDVGEVKIVVKF